MKLFNRLFYAFISMFLIFVQQAGAATQIPYDELIKIEPEAKPLCFSETVHEYFLKERGRYEPNRMLPNGHLM